MGSKSAFVFTRFNCVEFSVAMLLNVLIVEVVTADCPITALSLICKGRLQTDCCTSILLFLWTTSSITIGDDFSISSQIYSYTSFLVSPSTTLIGTNRIKLITDYQYLALFQINKSNGCLTIVYLCSCFNLPSAWLVTSFLVSWRLK